MHRPTADWLLEYSNGVARHVETLVIHSPTAAQRRLTIDLLLPQRGLRRSMWMLPVTRLAKVEPGSFIDLVDEQRRSIALPTRQESDVITYQVLEPHIVGVGTDAIERTALRDA